jgi:hypothetical protein
MAFPTAINDQITDSVSQANTKVLGDAPAVGMGNLFVATGQALSNAAHNASNNQQQSYVTMQASTTQGVGTLLTMDTGSSGSGTSKILSQGGVKGLGTYGRGQHSKTPNQLAR